MARPSSPTVSRRELANTLRLLRQRAGRTLEEAATALEVSAATLSRIETGVRVPRARDVKDLCAFYDITDPARIASLTSLVADAKESGWWEAYSEVDDEYATLIGLETAATDIDQFEGTLIPALLQTEEYSRAYLTDGINPGRARPFSEHDIAKRIEVRGRRQQLLTAGTGLRYTAIIDETALLRTTGGVEAMRRQLKHLSSAMKQPDIEVLIVPLERGAHPGQQGDFTVLTLPQEQVSDVVYIDSVGGQIFLETMDEIARHRRIFEAIREKSLDPSASSLYLQDLTDRL
jgi:transcriptional regulator with XRE-family HTH domain